MTTRRRLALGLVAVLGWSAAGAALAEGATIGWAEAAAAMGLPTWQEPVPAGAAVSQPPSPEMTADLKAAADALGLSSPGESMHGAAPSPLPGERVADLAPRTAAPVAAAVRREPGGESGGPADEAERLAAIWMVLMADEGHVPASRAVIVSSEAAAPARVDAAVPVQHRPVPTRAEIEKLFDRPDGAETVALDAPSPSTIPAAPALPSPPPDSAAAEVMAMREPDQAPASALASVVPVASGLVPPTETEPFSGRLAVADSQLDQVRGGFEAANGLTISFGIERAVYVNGDLVTTTSLNVSDLGKVSAGQARLPGSDAAAMTLIQNGPGNTFLANPSASSVGTVIQNTLNNQKIQNITSINAVVNSAQVFRGLSLQSTLNSALTSALRR